MVFVSHDTDVPMCRRDIKAVPSTVEVPWILHSNISILQFTYLRFPLDSVVASYIPLSV